MLFPRRHRESVANVFKEINVHISAFVRGQLIVACILALLYSIGLALVDLKFWLLLGIISGLGNIIPYVGFAVGITLSSIIALVQYGSVGGVMVVWIVYIVVQALEGMVISPRIIGQNVGISPLAIILGLMAGGQLFGFLGILLAIPVLAGLKVVFINVHRQIIENR